MGTDVFIKVYADVYLTTEGVGIYVAPEGDFFKEVIIPYEKLVEDFMEMLQVPSNPPTMHDKDREEVTNLANALLKAIDHLRKLEHDTGTWKPKDSLGY